uniref:Uncharacterized protein n=1 Tax=Chromera velia CCMP2878 TaxID=1169474 RepID=A0A0G4I1A8_9ALVE|eukprot:Cvel_34664.t1-p1 / transcript=Cvel_34664.t1 / gene=Cvel_34664 / organism=Chromera_velia_CCMP2878 / gene_product=hypothetical protein / transcript_product=hypothetical protein / location=Cvel_scaffold6030:1079-3012(+) / protein_length=380 / sequence_SO=supercontig / SO=protein_coding / is_pseudo=false
MPFSLGNFVQHKSATVSEAAKKFWYILGKYLLENKPDMEDYEYTEYQKNLHIEKHAELWFGGSCLSNELIEVIEDGAKDSSESATDKSCLDVAEKLFQKSIHLQRQTVVENFGRLALVIRRGEAGHVCVLAALRCLCFNIIDLRDHVLTVERCMKVVERELTRKRYDLQSHNVVDSLRLIDMITRDLLVRLKKGETEEEQMIIRSTVKLEVFDYVQYVVREVFSLAVDEEERERDTEDWKRLGEIILCCVCIVKSFGDFTFRKMDLDFCWEDQDVWMDGFQKIFQRPEMGAHERSKAMVFRIFVQWRDWLSRTLDVNSSHSRLAEALDIALRQQSHLKTKVESKTKKEQPEGTEVTAKPFVSLECVVKREGTLSSGATEP